MVSGKVDVVFELVMDLRIELDNSTKFDSAENILSRNGYYEPGGLISGKVIILNRTLKPIDIHKGNYTSVQFLLNLKKKKEQVVGKITREVKICFMFYTGLGITFIGKVWVWTTASVEIFFTEKIELIRSKYIHLHMKCGNKKFHYALLTNYSQLCNRRLHRIGTKGFIKIEISWSTSNSSRPNHLQIQLSVSIEPS